MTGRFTSLAEVQAELRSAAITLPTLVEYYLEQAARHQSLNAYVELFAEEARQRARELDARFRETPDQMGPLFGMVLSIKDVICYADHAVTAGSRILQGFNSLFSATAVERLLAADAIIIGRTNCDEFAMGSSNETSIYGPVQNAADPSRIPGGSSGGSAVSVQADTCLAAIGSDTGGSVRQPGAFCGLVGFKPSYGAVSRHGLIAYASSFDQIGVITRSVADATLLVRTMAGPDGFDATCRPEPIDFEGGADGPRKIAYFPTALHHPSLDPDLRSKSEAFITSLRAAGHEVTAVPFDLLDYLVPAYYVLTTAEASSNLSRYDGIRYGYRSSVPGTMQEVYTRSRSEGFGQEVKRRILLGTFVLSSGYYEAYFRKAQQIRRLLVEQIQDLFATYDFLLLPTTPGPAWALGSKQEDPVSVYLADIFTVIANLCGIPAISLPLGLHAGTGMPLGIQLLANRFEDGCLLHFARQVARQ